MRSACRPGLQTSSFNQLENRLANMIGVVLSVIFLAEAFQWQPGSGILNFGLAIGVVILGISAFLYQEGKSSRPDNHE